MRAPTFVAFVAGLLLVAAAYWPGLAGGFLFDDFVNLSTLGAYGPVDDARTLLLYLTSGIADPTGRPVSVASFLLDARNWPADPWPFKRTNLLLHLLNGALIAAVLLRLEAWLGERGAGIPPSRRGSAAGLAAMLWLAHPLFVSTTLYVVQRHAMLPLTFTLLSILCWDRSCAGFLRGRRRAGWCWALLGMWPAFALAGLSKANGLLAPLLVMVVHALCIRPAFPSPPGGRANSPRHAATVALGIPAAAVLLALWQRVPPSLDWTGARSFTLGERLLTQPRVLFDYLAHLAVPRAGGGGVFVEDFAKSTGLLQPSTTLLALLALAALLGAAWALRRRQPALATAIAFYFAGHVMESSAIMLELYFEHRNYLPAALLFWPLARWLVAGRALPRLRPWLALALPLLLLGLTFQRASVWGDPLLLTRLSVAQQPESVRARIVAANETGRAMDPRQAVEELRLAVRQKGATTAIVFNLVGQECALGSLAPETDAAMQAALAHERNWHSHTIRWLRSALQLAADGGCKGLDHATVDRWLQVMQANPSAGSTATRRQNLLHLRAAATLNAGAPSAALELFERALAAQPNPDTALSQAALLGAAGQPGLGLKHLDAFERMPMPARPMPRNMQALHRSLLLRSGYHEEEIEHLRKALGDAAASRETPASDRGPPPTTEGR